MTRRAAFSAPPCVAGQIDDATCGKNGIYQANECGAALVQTTCPVLCGVCTPPPCVAGQVDDAACGGKNGIYQANECGAVLVQTTCPALCGVCSRPGGKKGKKGTSAKKSKGSKKSKGTKKSKGPKGSKLVRKEGAARGISPDVAAGGAGAVAMMIFLAFVVFKESQESQPTSPLVKDDAGEERLVKAVLNSASREARVQPEPTISPLLGVYLV